MLPRTQYIDKLVRKKDNGRVKVITGLRRSGKSVLLFRLYRDHLIGTGIREDQIIGLALDVLENAKYRNPMELDKWIRERITDTGTRYYVFIDEIQFVSEIRNPYLADPNATIGFVDVILGLMQLPNADIYITGSNSKMLSSDIVTQFRDRADEIRVYPLSYAEFYEAYEGDRRGAWQEYYTYGGMPVVLSLDSHEEKSEYLKRLFSQTYIRDILERNRIRNDAEVLGILLDVLSSSVGSLTNPTRISNTFDSERQIRISPNTVDTYIGYCVNAFLLDKAVRYDVKGKEYIKNTAKYYFTDLGLRNARLGFRQLEESHLMENVIYNDLVRRGFDVDVGVVEYNTTDRRGIKVRKQLEVDFVVNRGSERCYIQSTLSIADPEKKAREIESLLRTPDSFRKIVIVKDYLKPWTDDHGIQYIGAENFLLDENLI